MKLFALFLLTLFSINIDAYNCSSNVQDDFEEFFSLYNANKYDDAASILLNIEKELTNPKSDFQAEKYVRAMYLLSNLYSKQNMIKQSEEVIVRAEGTMNLHGMVQSPLMRYLLLSRGLLYFLIGDTNDAKLKLLEAKDLFEKENNCKTIEYISCLYNLGCIYNKTGMFWFSNILLNKALEIVDDICSIANNDTPEVCKLFYINIKNGIALNYDEMGDYEQSLNIRNDIINFAQKNQLLESAGSVIMNLINTEVKRGNYQIALEYLHILNDFNWDYMTKDGVYENFFFPLYFLNDKQRILDLLEQYIIFTKTNLKSIFLTYSESERENYVYEKGERLNFFTNALCLKYQTDELIKMSFDNSLFTKTMMTSFYKFLNNYAKNSPSECIRGKYQNLVDLKKEITKKNLPNDTYVQNVEKIKVLEHEIVSSIENYKDMFDDSQLSWENIKNCLAEGEVAIEFNLFPELITENRSINPYYGALIVSPSKDYPIFVKLCEQEKLNAILRRGNKTEAQFIDELYDLTNDKLYNYIFKPIEKYLKDCKTLFFSPVGKLNKINLQAVAGNGERLMDRYKMIEVSSTAKLLERQKGKMIQDYSRAYVVGGVDYNEGIEEMALEANKYADYLPHFDLATRSSYRGIWDNIPGTLCEAESIDSLLHAHNIESVLLKNNSANEESFKQLDGNSPEIIHVATHGFFYEKKEESSSHFFDNIKSYTLKGFPMKYSGLLFAGANNVWTGKMLPEQIEDGILTAEEISHLDLTNTKLAVLSACDTGLGEIDNVDGVYGLQRGFKMAGVETIMMSLWKIPDEATSVLMVEFYKNLTCGKSKQQSLKDAQKHLRQVENGKYDKPEYWASFIMLDGLN